VLTPPDSHCFTAAVGWMELGNPREAQVELDRITPAHQHDLEVLDLRWMLRALEKDWTRALGIARLQLEHHPDEPAGWLHQAYALRRIEGGGLDPTSAIRARWKCRSLIIKPTISKVCTTSSGLEQVTSTGQTR
jgi:hypothetical protein